MIDPSKFLGVRLNNNMDWLSDTEALYRKGRSRLFFLRKLRSFNFDTRLLPMFYHSAVASVLVFAAECRGVGIGSGGTNKQKKFIGNVSSVVRMLLDSVEAVTERRMTGKLKAIMD